MSRTARFVAGPIRLNGFPCLPCYLKAAVMSVVTAGFCWVLQMIRLVVEGSAQALKVVKLSDEDLVES